MPDSIILCLAQRLHRYLISQEQMRYIVYSGMKARRGDMKCQEQAVTGYPLEAARCGESNEVLKWWAVGQRWVLRRGGGRENNRSERPPFESSAALSLNAR